jgi:hypothetical protein
MNGRRPVALLILICIHVYLSMEKMMKRICFLGIMTILLASCATLSPTPTPTLPPTAETPNTLL